MDQIEIATTEGHIYCTYINIWTQILHTDKYPDTM